MLSEHLKEIRSRLDDIETDVYTTVGGLRRMIETSAGRMVLDLVRVSGYLRSLLAGVEGEDRDEIVAEVRRIHGMQDSLAEVSEFSGRPDDYHFVHLLCEARTAVDLALSQCRPYDVHALNDPAVRQRVRNLTDGRCSYCDCDLPDNWHIDHVVPKSAGGPDNIANYVPSCPSCNISKNGNHVLDFIKKSRGKVVAFRSEGAA